MHWWRAWRQRAIVLGALLAAAGVLVPTLVTPWQVAGGLCAGRPWLRQHRAGAVLAGHQTRMPGALATAVSTLGFAGILPDRR